MRLLSITLAVLLAGPAGAVCLENRSDQQLFGTAESDDGDGRVTGWLEPGERLCAGRAESAGTVGVFENPTVFEGCSRRVPRAVGPAGLLEFTRFDRCRWAERAG